MPDTTEIDNPISPRGNRIMSSSVKLAKFAGLDIAKSNFQVHCLDGERELLIRRNLKRSQVAPFFERLPRLKVGVEAGAAAHHWARQLSAIGHEVAIIPGKFVSAFRVGQKNDANDAEAICFAVMQPSSPIVPIKAIDRQSILMVHRSRELLKKQKIQLLNFMRSLLAEFGVILPLGTGHVLKYVSDANRIAADKIPSEAFEVCNMLLAQAKRIDQKITKLERIVLLWHEASQVSKRLATIPGVGLITATALAATVDDPQRFRTARHFASWLGLSPRQHSTGGRARLGAITRRGDPYLRRLLVSGALPLVARARKKALPQDVKWKSMLERKHPRIVTIAIANRNARIAWAIMRYNSEYVEPSPSLWSQRG